MADPATLSDLQPDPENRRRHGARNLQLLAASLREVGASRSIVIDEAGTILAGNGVVQAASAAGVQRVRVVDTEGDEIVAVRRRGLSAEQKRALAIFDNRTAELAEWNWDQLQADHDAGLVLEPWWTPEELAAGLPGGHRGGRTEPDEAPPLRATSIQPGDLFALGNHRVLCGDATDPAQVARVLGGALAQIVFTDPPYGVHYRGGQTSPRVPLAGDDSGALYRPCAEQAFRFSDEAAALYVWFAGHLAGTAQAAARSAGYEVRAALVWNKQQAQFGALAAHYKIKHECGLYCVKAGHASRWCGPTNEVTVWDIERARTNEFHPTQKPVALAERALQNSSLPGDRVLDLFLGSGSTLIACETLGRHGYGLELEPGYVQVILDRWEAFTGRRADKL